MVASWVPSHERHLRPQTLLLHTGLCVISVLDEMLPNSGSLEQKGSFFVVEWMTKSDIEACPT
ncbi:hypothetical protein OUZ56_002639 [Daphnia magna]|uniref:Uncharacterized protein n=1 Tax=Daphnia magna TaxID=35525 RepID=A0ABR0A6K4_9CRUS|nr:hypothetical protein OUZ56_002639 [Daphnia magna]